MPNAIHLLIIDPQNDFCDLPDSYLPPNPLQSGANLYPQLPVPGAHADMHRLARFIHRQPERIAHITITLDSHHHIAIERPTLWQQSNGSPVSPFTPITAAQVRSGLYLPSNPDHLPAVLHYLDALEAAGRYTHMVWPVHCEIGTWGHNIHADILAACNAWEQRKGLASSKVLKGANPFTEHYSALMAEVPDPKDPNTELNRPLLSKLLQADNTLYVAGEAGSHCVRATLEHLVQYADSAAISRIALLTDCMSPIPGFEDSYQNFLTYMTEHGAKLTTSSAIL